MSPHPIRLILCGYGLALCPALVIARWSLTAAVLSFWIGGAVATVLLAVAPGRLGRAFRRAEDAGTDCDAALAAALEAWGRDAEADRAVAARRREA